LRTGLPADRRSAGLRHPAVAEEDSSHRKHCQEIRDAQRMSTEATTLAQRLSARFGDQIAATHEWRGETIIDVAPANWLAVAQALRDEDELHFEQLIDVAGVDYASYGQAEWDTTDVSSTGFSRGVEGEGPGRFDWADRPREKAGNKRFAAVVQ